jgi:hypothetical protein
MNFEQQKPIVEVHVLVVYDKPKACPSKASSLSKLPLFGQDLTYMAIRLS